MAAANESQGLKIAVVTFIVLTVILTVTSYFLYSAYSAADARLTSANDQLAEKSKASSLAVTQYNEVRSKVGTKNEEYDQAKEEINAHFKKMDQRLEAVLTATNAAVQKAQADGAQGTELEEAKQNIQKISVAKTQVDKEADAAAKSQADVLSEQKNHEEARGILVTKVSELQAANDKLNTEIANLTTKVKQQEEDFARKQETLTTIIREERDQNERKELILDRPDGYVTYVDYERREVLVSLNKRQGARPQMKMTIFDAKSPGIPTERPKGNIELTQIGDQFSAARIVKTDSTTDPIRVGDIVYSAAWSPNQPMRFALVGKIDVNRDGRDDRAELRRMIEEAGGTIDFDLPPADLGKETGSLSPRIDWYVIDNRKPLREVYAAKNAAVEVSQEKLNQRVGEVVREARLNGIRPMTIEHLLAFLGYDMNAPIIGRPEAVNANALKRLTSPRRTGEGVAKPSTDSTTKADAKADDETPAEKPQAKTKKAQPKKAADADEPQ
jgi:hypothetical protein